MRSQWHFSKMYIWNNHLSDNDFTLASLYLNSELVSLLPSATPVKSVPVVPQCLVCPVSSTSPSASNTFSACACNPGYTEPNGGTCTACAENQFKASTGSASCALCPPNAQSPAASNISSACRCNAGYFGANGQTCTRGVWRVRRVVDNRFENSNDFVRCCNSRQEWQDQSLRDSCDIMYSNDGLTYTTQGSFSINIPRSSWDAKVHVVFATAVTTQFVKISITDFSFRACMRVGVILAPCQSCPANSLSPAASPNVTLCGCNAGFSGPDGGPCTVCFFDTVKTTQGSAPCVTPLCAVDEFQASQACWACPMGMTSPAGSPSRDNCVYWPDQIRDSLLLVCKYCPPCTFRENSTRCAPYGKFPAPLFMGPVLARNVPFITSLASDWNALTQKFDSKCAGQTCAGNTGAKSAGTVTIGTVDGHCAAGSVAFVSGTTSTTM